MFSNNLVTKRTYLPQLDSLRVFAILGVLVLHYLNPPSLPWIFKFLNWGHLGVRLFFVLSGFLITGILIDCRDQAEKTPNTSLFSIRQFYIRRFLRIFPIYYLVLAIVLFFNVPPSREIWPWLVSYTSNIYIWLHQTWIGSVGHFWTLAVEEQFYLIWPWLVLFAPRKKLIFAILGIILLAPLFRYYAITQYPEDFYNGLRTTGTFTFASLDSLGIGALLSIVYRYKRETLIKYLTRIVLPAGIGALLLLDLLAYYKLKFRLLITFEDIAYALIFCWLIGKASLSFKGIPGKILEFKPLIYLGKISYGVYIYHPLVPLLLASIFHQFGATYPETGWFTFFTSSTITILIASLSWFLFEKPINRLKRYFRYNRNGKVFSPSKVAEI
ncbi:MAG: acyltransferase [Anaerolineales bacterium]|jgi:peptidoglycan/LPS O-acetylase OafA/YrhL